MAGYRRVNYYELCRLCTSSEGTKMHIFREEGRRRSLPSKIQTCLPLQVQEEDSLPKIICSSCVEKLESYFEFREACINAEAMLESYFTSLKYSEDLSREGKVSVYVKDEPIKKKDESTSTTKVKIPVNSVANISNVTSIGDGNAILPSAIQILTDSEGNRLTQYKVQVGLKKVCLIPCRSNTTGSNIQHNFQVQGGIPALVPYAEQSGLPLSVSIPTLTPQPLKQQSTSANNSSRTDDGTQTTSDSRNIPPPPPLVAAVAIAPPNQEILQQIGLAAKDRGTITEVLKLKNVNILDPSTCEPVAVTNPHIHGNHITGQVSNVLPAQIRLDQGQLQQIINSNLQINLSQLQQGQRETVLQCKGVSVGRSVVQMCQNSMKGEGNAKSLEEKEEGEPKGGGTSMNGSEDQCNNSLSGKSNCSINDDEKAEEGLKFDENGVEMEHNLEEDIEEVQEENAQNANNEENQTYECDTCAKTFRRKEHLFQHKKSHSGERPFVCSTCTKAFSRKEHLLRHNVSHTGQKLYGCDVCHKSFSRKDNLHKHKKTHGINGPHVCETCGRSFVVKHYYIMHKAQHENFPNTENSSGVSVKHLISTNSTVNPLPFKCDLCTKSFSIKSYLTSHRLRHRSKVKTDEPQEQPQPQPQQQEHQSSSDLTIPQPTILTSFPATAANLNLATLNTQLTTINPNALLAPNIIHHSNANVVHIGNNSYLCTSNVTSDLLEQYRRIHS